MPVIRTLPPAAAPIYCRDILAGMLGLVRGQRELNRFELEIKKYFGAKHCFLVSSGKAALTLILEALKDIHPCRNQVLIPAFICYSVPSAIVRAGLKVRLCDIGPKTLDFDFGRLSKILSQYLPSGTDEAAGSNRLLAVISAHLFGLPADVDHVRELAKCQDAVIVEDAAQAMGTERRGRKSGMLGDVSFFSLGRGKALSAMEGGIILTDRQDIAGRMAARLADVPDYNVFELIRLVVNVILLSLFMHPSLFWFPKLFPFLRIGDTIYDPGFKIRKMSSFQAGLARGWQDKLKKFKKIREINSRLWSTLIKNSKDYDLLSKMDSNFIRFPVKVHNASVRNNILMESKRNGLGIMPTYPDSIDGIQELRDDFKGMEFPVAKEYCNRLITLPVHPYVTENDRRRIAALISQTDLGIEKCWNKR